MLYQLYKAIEKPNASAYGKLVQRVILINVLINISTSLLLIFFIRDPIVRSFLIYIEHITVFFFCAELILRYTIIGYDNRYKGVIGRLRYTLTPFIIIDLVSLIPYFITGIRIDSLLGRLVRFLKFFKVLKFLRLKNTIKNIFSLSFFATAPIILQLFILLVISMTFIGVFSLALKDMKLSAMIFLGPGAIAEVHSHEQALFGLLELVVGLIVGGTLISIISSLLTNIVSNIKGGYYPYRGKDHIIIINNNVKLDFILREINCYYFDVERCKDVILFLPNVQDVEGFSQNLEKFSNIRVFIIKGSPFIWGSYKKLSINKCEKIIILEDSINKIPYIENKVTRFILSHQEFTNESAVFAIEANAKQNLDIYREIFSQNINPYHIINSDEVIQRLLNRSIVNPIYFEIYSELLSYKDWKLDNIKLLQADLSFKEVYMRLQGCTALGVVKNGQVILNPDKDLIVTNGSEVIVILQDKYGHYLEDTSYGFEEALTIQPPKLRIKRKICIVGSFDNIQIERINEFLEEDSIQSLECYSAEINDNYLSKKFWEDIVEQKFDMIILNLEDDFEFVLTMYLRNNYKDKEVFLKSIVNIVHDPVYEQLLKRDKTVDNVILSDEIAANYTVQLLFNPHMSDIFREITSSDGNEFYILNRRDHSLLFNMDVSNLKIQLLENNMIYVGTIIDEQFYIDSNNIAKSDQLVVLAKGK